MNMKIEHKFFKDFNHEENILFHIDLSFPYFSTNYSQLFLVFPIGKYKLNLIIYYYP